MTFTEDSFKFSGEKSLLGMTSTSLTNTSDHVSIRRSSMGLTKKFTEFEDIDQETSSSSSSDEDYIEDQLDIKLPYEVN